MAEEIVRAKSKYVRVSPKKAAIALDLIRGQNYEEAERILTFTPNKTAKIILKTLKSAGANASNNKSFKVKDLFVSEAHASGGPVLKRGRIVGRARVSPILKRTSNILIVLSDISEKGKAK